MTVAIASGSAAPYGAVAAINSTLAHASAATRRRLRIHVFTPADVHDAISRKLGRIFAAGADGVPSIAVRPAPVERLAKLASRLAAIGVAVPPFEMPLLWLPATLGPEVSRALVLADDAVLLTDAAELHDVALGPKKVGAAIEECATTFETLFNYHHATFNGHSRSSCAFDAGVATLDLKAWRREDLSTRIIELMGQQRVDQLYVHGASGLSAAVPTLLALDKRLLRLPSRWLARGLARDSWSHGELAYWQRYWGQQGEKLPFVPRPLRAPHATAAPRREIGDALVLRFSGSLFADGRFKPWLRRCSGEAADGAPRCGRRGLDCARLWWRLLERALPLVEAAVTDDKLRRQAPPRLRRARPNGPPKREWFDPETFLAPNGEEKAEAPMKARSSRRLPTDDGEADGAAGEGEARGGQRRQNSQSIGWWATHRAPALHATSLEWRERLPHVRSVESILLITDLVNVGATQLGRVRISIPAEVVAERCRALVGSHLAPARGWRISNATLLSSIHSSAPLCIFPTAVQSTRTHETRRFSERRERRSNSSRGMRRPTSRAYWRWMRAHFIERDPLSTRGRPHN